MIAGRLVGPIRLQNDREFPLTAFTGAIQRCSRLTHSVKYWDYAY